GRTALAASLPERTDQTRRRSALDQVQSKLEFHVRRVPFNRRAQELRRRCRSFRNDLGRDQCWLRGMSWRGIAPRRMGARPETLVAFRQDGRPDQGTRGAVRRADRHDLDARRKNRNAAAQWNAVRSAQRGRNVRTVPCTTRTVLGKMDSRAVPFKYPPGR